MAQISYAIGVAKPTSLMVDIFGTGKIPEAKIVELVAAHFDLRPRGYARSTAPDLYQYRELWPRGRDEPDFTWEVTDKAATLKRGGWDLIRLSVWRCAKKKPVRPALFISMNACPEYSN